MKMTFPIKGQGKLCFIKCIKLSMWTPLVVQQFRLHASTAEVMSSTLVLETRSFMPRDRRLPSWHNGKESAHQRKRHGFNPWLGMIPWSRKWQLAPVFLPGKFHGQRSLEGYSPQSHKESDTTKRLHFLSFYITSDKIDFRAKIVTSDKSNYVIIKIQFLLDSVSLTYKCTDA